MALISQKEVLKIALMSRIEIHPDEIESITAQLESVLSYAQRVTQITQVQEQVVQNTNIFRPDQVTNTPAQPLLARGPATQDNFYVVPAILEH